MSQRALRVNPVGYYGWDNFGDELFRDAIQRNTHLLWGDGTKVRFFVFPVKGLRQNEGIIGGTCRALSMVVGGIWSQRIALCGGSVLEDIKGVQSLRSRIFRRFRKFEALGVSMGPWKDEEAAARVLGFAKEMDRLVVRDTASFARSNQFAVLAGDLAALYPMSHVREEDRQMVTVCPSNDSGVTAQELTNAISDALRDSQEPVRLLALNSRKGSGDIELCIQISQMLKSEGIESRVEQFHNVEQTIAIIASSKAVWSQRLHGVIVAYLCDVPFLALAHHQKISDFGFDIGVASDSLIKDLSSSTVSQAASKLTPSGPRPWKVAPKDYIGKVHSSFLESLWTR